MLNSRQIVRASYNKIASEYEATRKHDSEDVQLLRKLLERLSRNSTVLDAGSGSGYPVTQFLALHFQVTAIDFALEQIRLAKDRVRGVEFVCADMKPGGLALLCTGAGDLPRDKSRYHGVPMFWSHFDRETNLRMIRDTGLRILWSKTIVDPTNPTSAHLFVFAQKRE